MNFDKFLLFFQNLGISSKAAAGVAAATTGMGVSGTFNFLDLIPNDIAKLATVIGIILSVVLIYTHIRRGRIEYKKVQLEILLMKEKQAKTVENVEHKKHLLDFLRFKDK